VTFEIIFLFSIQRMAKINSKIISVILSLFFFTELSWSAPDFKPGVAILDQESESYLIEWLQKLFDAAGLKKYKPKVHVIVNPDINAAATLGGQIIIFSGLISKCDSAEQLLGVLAHEVGHIAGGHVSQFDAAAEKAIIPAAAALILGGAAALATGDFTPLTAGSMMGSHLFERGILKFSRAQESSADQAALTYLDKLKWPAIGLKQFLEILNTQMLASSVRHDPYAVTHPLTGDRIQAIRNHIDRSGIKERALPPIYEIQFKRMKAKITGFVEPISTVQRLYPSMAQSLEAKYAHAILFYRQGQTEKALKEITFLSESFPDDIYYTELKAQILFETGKVAESIPLLQKIVQKSPGSFLIKLSLSHALLEEGKPGSSQQVINLLRPLTQKNGDNIFLWKLLAIAYGKEQNIGLSALCLAEEAFLKEDYAFAESQLKRAKALLPKGDKDLMRVEDLLKLISKKSSNVIVEED
jgi:predicted Zn-dependent protease